jgi:hypothetical protein
MNQPKCQICGRALENLDSITRGIGPECLVKREKFLAAGGANVAEIESLALCGDPNVTRWITWIWKAIGRGRQGDVDRFIEAARRARQASALPAAA